MKKMKASTMRLAAMLAVFAIVVIGLATHSGTGTVSSFGLGSIAAICPLGALETLLASKLFVPQAVISLAVLFVLAIIIGKVFCAWICPVPLVRRVFPSRFKKTPNGEGNGTSAAAAPEAVAAEASGAAAHPAPHAVFTREDALAEEAAVDSGEEIIPEDVKEAIEASDFHAPKPSGVKLDSRHWILGGALVSTAIFGFPVFCLICPIGLTFASVIALWRLFGYNEPTILLIVFPAILILELVVFRKWCAKICPVGALISLASGLNTLFRPKVDGEKCLRTTRGIDCRSCKTACFEEIDLHHAGASAPMSECTKCRECADACPVSAISFPFSSKKKAESRAASAAPEASEDRAHAPAASAPALPAEDTL